MNRPQDISLLESACNGNLEQVKKLLEKDGADINICDGNFCTPLHLASGNGHLEVVKYLITRTPRPFIDCIGDIENVTPLHYAARNAHLEVVKLLIENGANINAMSISKETPLDEAIKQFQTPEGRTERYQEYKKVIEWLKNNNAIFNNTKNPYPF